MLRIRVVDLSESAVVLRVEGRITGSWAEELRRTCAAHAFAAHAFAAHAFVGHTFVGHTFPDEVQLSLELSDVSFADAAGIALLKELRSGGADLIRPTPFIAERLKDGPSFDTV
jgi:anti-anti-sigma regulatory factor